MGVDRQGSLDPQILFIGTRAAETEDSAVEEGTSRWKKAWTEQATPQARGVEQRPRASVTATGGCCHRGAGNARRGPWARARGRRAPLSAGGVSAAFLLRASSPPKGRPWAVAGNPAGPASPSAEAGTHALVIARQHRCLSLQHLRDLRQEAGPSSPVRPSKVLPPAYSCQLNAQFLFIF